MANELRVRANFAGGAVEDNPLTAGATTLTSAGLAGVPAIGATQHAALIVDPDGEWGTPEIVWITAHTAGATTATIVRGKEGTTARQHDRDVYWVHGPTLKDFHTVKFATRTSGDVSITTTSYMDVDTGLDLVLAAAAGDVIEVGAALRWEAKAVYGNIDVATIVSAAPVNYLSGAGSGGEGIPGWFGDGSGAAINFPQGGGTVYTVVSGDLASGYVTLRVRAKVNTSTRLIRAQANIPFRWWAKNLGQQGD